MNATETVAHQALVSMGTLGLVRGPHQVLAVTFTLFQSGGWGGGNMLTV